MGGRGKEQLSTRRQWTLQRQAPLIYFTENETSYQSISVTTAVCPLRVAHSAHLGLVPATS